MGTGYMTLSAYNDIALTGQVRVLICVWLFNGFREKKPPTCFRLMKYEAPDPHPLQSRLPYASSSKEFVIWAEQTP